MPTEIQHLVVETLIYTRHSENRVGYLTARIEFFLYDSTSTDKQKKGMDTISIPDPF